MSQSSYGIFCDIADRVEAELRRLQEIEKVVKSHPEWQEQEPELKKLLEPINAAKKKDNGNSKIRNTTAVA